MENYCYRYSDIIVYMYGWGDVFVIDGMFVLDVQIMCLLENVCGYLICTVAEVLWFLYIPNRSVVFCFFVFHVRFLSRLC